MRVGIAHHLLRQPLASANTVSLCSRQRSASMRACSSGEGGLAASACSCASRNARVTIFPVAPGG